MENILYLECYSGISGDMFVGALLDLGVDKEYLLSNLKTLPIDGYKIEISDVKKMTINACDFNVILEKDNHDHDMEYLYGAYHEKHHAHHENHSHHEHRGLLEIEEVINKSKITDNAKKIALNIFNIIAKAEAKAHGVAVSEVHFHEVGAIDSIVDIVAAAICIDKLHINKVICPNLYEGRGFVRCQHGKMPIPVPAVVNIAIEHKLKLHYMDIEGELITPTGAAIVAGLNSKMDLPQSFNIKKIGIGAGKREYSIPNIIRAMLIEE